MKDQCDHAGVWRPNIHLFNRLFNCNCKLNEIIAIFNSDKERIRSLNNGRWFIVDFIPFQYGKLRNNNGAHRSAIKILDDNNITTNFLATDEEISMDKYRMSVFHSYNQKCLYCEKKLYINNFVIDHINPKNNGGTNEPENLALSCSSCNSFKHDLSLEAFCDKSSLDYSKIQNKIKGALKVLYRGFKAHKEKDKDKDKDNIETNPEIKIFIDYWHAKYFASTKTKYVFHGAKEGQLIKMMLKAIPLDELKKRADAFFASKDKFIEEAGYTIGVFSSQINKINKPQRLA